MVSSLSEAAVPVLPDEARGDDDAAAVAADEQADTSRAESEAKLDEGKEDDA